MFNGVQLWYGIYSFFVLLAILGVSVILFEGFFTIKKRLFSRILYFRVKRRIKRNPELNMSDETIKKVILDEQNKMNL